MGKDVNVEVPCAHLEFKAHNPEATGERAVIHFIPVPAEALAEVQEVLKKYKPQLDKFNELLAKVAKQQGE